VAELADAPDSGSSSAPQDSRNAEKRAGVSKARSPEIATRGAAVGQPGPTVAELRAALDDAIRARAWSAVEAINERLREVELDGVVDLEVERVRRGRR
jgi:hypothetical protein